MRLGNSEHWFDAVDGTRFVQVRHVSETGSTNTDLLEAARAGESEGVVLVADAQTAGRGRRGRSWSAPPASSLMMSVLLRPPSGTVRATQASLVTTALACAAAAACENVAGVAPKLKWPNDLVIETNGSRGAGDRDWDGFAKLAGVLTETLLDGQFVRALVVGMGLNVNWPQVPAELAGVMTSLNLLCGAAVSRVELARELLIGFERRYGRLVDGPATGARLYEPGVASLLDEATSRSATLGRTVTVELGGKAAPLVGTAVALDATGALIIEDADGERHIVTVGEVVHARHTGSSHT